MKKILVFLSVVFSLTLVVVGLNVNHSLNAGALDAEENNLIFTTDYNQEGLMLITVEDSFGAPIIEQQTGSFEGYFEDLAKIRISVNELENDFVNFAGVFLNDDNEPLMISDSEYIIDVLDNTVPTSIKIIFNPVVFTLDTVYRENPNSIIVGEHKSGFVEYSRINRGIEEPINDNEVKFGETLKIAAPERIIFENPDSTYFFSELYFNIPVSGYGFEVTDSGGYLIDEEFLEEYSILGTTINFIAVYTQELIYEVDLNFKALSSFAQSFYVVPFELSVIEGEARGNGYLINSKLQIKFTLKDYTELAKLTDGRYDIDDLNYAPDTDTVEVNGKEITITFNILKDKNFEIRLNLVSFKIDDSGSALKGTTVLFNKTNFVYGDKIEINAIAEGSSEIKSWEINGIKVPKKIGESENGIKRIANNKAEIDTAEWYKSFGVNFNKFTNEITLGMKSSMLMVIILPIGAVVIAGVILMLIMLSHAKTKNKIKAVLEAQKQAAYTYDAGSLISDLKEGKSLKVTDEDIKAEIKKHKNSDE